MWTHCFGFLLLLYTSNSHGRMFLVYVPTCKSLHLKLFTLDLKQEASDWATRTTWSCVELKTFVSIGERALIPLNGLDWLVLDWLGLDWLRLAWIGLAWLGFAWIGLGWLRLDWLGFAWLGIRLDWLGLAWNGLSLLGWAWISLDWLRLAWIGFACPVSAWPGLA